MTDKLKRLKALFEAPEILILPGVFDGYSVRLMEQMGFAAASVSGAGGEVGRPEAGPRAPDFDFLFGANPS